MKKILLSLAHMSGEEIKFINKAFDSNWVVPLGPNVDGFEEDLKLWLSKKSNTPIDITALCSGTAAIHLALVLLGVGPDDEVICQSFTFAASANPIRYQGATPVFVDSENDTWNMDPELLEKAINERLSQKRKLPKAIIVVHLYGTPAKMNEIINVANKYDIPLIEDAAEAIGSEYNGKYCGTMGKYGILSFNGNKMITTSGGGSLICHTSEESRLAKFFATQARENYPYYQHEKIGYNYRLSNICAGIGRGQMTILDDHISYRRNIHNLYLKGLSEIPGIQVSKPYFNVNVQPNFWLSTILINENIANFNCQELSDYLAELNIESRRLWKPLHLQPVFNIYPNFLNGISETIFNKGLCLPSGPLVSDEDVHFIIESIRSFSAKKSKIHTFKREFEKV